MPSLEHEAHNRENSALLLEIMLKMFENFMRRKGEKMVVIFFFVGQ